MSFHQIPCHFCHDAIQTVHDTYHNCEECDKFICNKPLCVKLMAMTMCHKQYPCTRCAQSNKIFCVTCQQLECRECERQHVCNQCRKHCYGTALGRCLVCRVSVHCNGLQCPCCQNYLCHQHVTTHKLTPSAQCPQCQSPLCRTKSCRPCESCSVRVCCRKETACCQRSLCQACIVKHDKSMLPCSQCKQPEQCHPCKNCKKQICSTCVNNTGSIFSVAAANANTCYFSGTCGECYYAHLKQCACGELKCECRYRPQVQCIQCHKRVTHVVHCNTISTCKKCRINDSVLCCQCVSQTTTITHSCACGKQLCVFHDQKHILKADRKCLQCIRTRKYVQAIFDRRWPRDINNLILDFAYHCPNPRIKCNARKNTKQQQALLEQTGIDYLYPEEIYK